jgi:glycosyltransferase involved in cell wall biosynthesis
MLGVLHASQPGDGGAAAVVAALAADQADRGHEVVVAGPRGSELESALAGSDVRLVGWSASRSPGPSSLGETRALARVIAAERPALVHLHSSKAGLAGRLALRGRLPTIFQPHGWSFEAVRGPVRAATVVWERRAARWADAIACVSDGERRRGEEVGIRGELLVVPNGVDLTAFRAAGPEEQASARSRLGLDAGPLAVCVGRLSEAKGQGVLVRAWPSVRARAPGARVVLVGGGPDEAELRRTAGEGVEFAGPRNDVRDWLVAADVVVAPSRWDALSLVLLEALACGRSLVATDVPGAREALGDETGAIVPVEAADELAAAVAERLLDPALAATEGAAARSRAERLFDLQDANERMAALYTDVLDRRRGKRASVDAVAARPAP